MTTWKLNSAQPIVVVHLSGAIRRLETELDGAGSLLHPPMNGEIWVVPARARYASVACGGVIRYAELFLDPDAFPDSSPGLRSVPIRPRAGHYDQHLYRTVQRLQFLTGQTGDLARMEAECLSRALYFHFFREYSEAPVPALRKRNLPVLQPQECRILREYIDDRLASPIVLADLARLVGRTAHELLIAFRGAFGTTPAQYVIERRLRLARSLLLKSAKDITSIALETGFSSHAHFTVAFMSRVGVTPSEFRAESGDRGSRNTCRVVGP